MNRMLGLQSRVAIVVVFVSLIANANGADPIGFDVHDPDRAQPIVIDPGPGTKEPAPIPSDAIILFDGHGIDEWQDENGREAGWSTENGYLKVVPGSGDIWTKRNFGSVQLYVEWASPKEVDGDAQDRGNSGIFLMDRYELQVLDSYRNTTYPDGQAAAIYGQYPPLANASRPPGRWQSYNIVFCAPEFSEDGDLTEPATMTVLHNGVVVQNSVQLTGPTGHYKRPDYEAHGMAPIRLQDHSSSTMYRRIWLRELVSGC